MKNLYWPGMQGRKSKELKDGVPCEHPGCLNHTTHPCEVCGRINGVNNMPTVKQIVIKYLEDNGYDGLWSDDCGCQLSDLMPCCGPVEYCSPGYKVDGCSDSCGLGCDFHIVPERKPE